MRLQKKLQLKLYKCFNIISLNDKGKISHKDAVQKALSEYEKYRIIQDKNYVSDFDKLLLEAKEVSFK